ncbi:hypothetical protein ACJ41O_001488 [Fusarium nematophilum]
MPASGEHVTGSPNEHLERDDEDRAAESDDFGRPVALDYIQGRLSDRPQGVQPAAVPPSDEPLLGITTPCTVPDIAAWMPTDAISPPWNDCMAADILEGNPFPDWLDQVALDMDLEPSYNGAWQYLIDFYPRVGHDLASSRLPASTLDPAALTSQDGHSNSSPSLPTVDLVVVNPASSATSKISDSADSPATATTGTSTSRYEQTIWVAPLPSRMPDMPVRDRLYLAHFTSQITNMMPGQVNYLREMAMESEPIRCCANALAAASLANRGGKFSNDGRGRWIAMQPHYSRALSFASRSMDMIHSGSGISLGCRVVMLTLMLCFQLESGCIGEIFRVLSVLDSTILGNKDAVLSLAHGRALVQCWLGLRALCEGTLRPHALYGKESQTELMVSELEGLDSATSETFSSIATRAHRLGRRILLCKCVGGNKGATADRLNRFDEWWSVVKCEQGHDTYGTLGFESSLPEDELFYELGRLKDALDISEIPSGLPLNFDPAVPVPYTATPEPLCLPSHEQAMELAAYASAQLACNENHLRALESPTFKPSTSRNPWLHLLLRIAAGLDPAQCSQRNMYRQGICYHLLCAVFLLQDLTAVHFLDDLYQRMMDAGGYYEDCFTPLSLSSLCNKLVCREMTRGRIVFMLCSTYNSWTTRDILFSMGDEESFIIFGREADGRYFSDVILMEDFDLSS